MTQKPSPPEDLDSDTDTDSEDRSTPPRSPLRVMQILAELAKSPNGITLARLSEQLQLPKTSLFNLLRSLEAGDFIISESGTHRLSRSAFNLAAAISQTGGTGLAGRLRPALQWLQTECSETVMLAVPSTDWSHLIFADVIEATSSLRFTARVGADRPLYSTSVGLALLAFASPEQQKLYIQRTKLVALTPTTITSVSVLQKTLHRVCKDGYIVNSGSVNGLTAIAVPVFGSQSEITASVSFAAPSSRIEDRSDELIDLAIEAGRRMSEALGYHKAYPKPCS